MYCNRCSSYSCACGGLSSMMGLAAAQQHLGMAQYNALSMEMLKQRNEEILKEYGYKKEIPNKKLLLLRK